jgi:hypothetical protein
MIWNSSEITASWLNAITTNNSGLGVGLHLATARRILHAYSCSKGNIIFKELNATRFS